jgi:hypothetical protein
MDYIEVEGEKHEQIINEDGKAYNGNRGALIVAFVAIAALSLTAIAEVFKAIF